MALPEEPALVHVDSWGLKRCFTHCLRRWLAGTVAPRVTQLDLLPCQNKVFMTLFFWPGQLEALQKLSPKMPLQNVSSFT